LKSPFGSAFSSFGRLLLLFCSDGDQKPLGSRWFASSDAYVKLLSFSLVSAGRNQIFDLRDPALMGNFLCPDCSDRVHMDLFRLSSEVEPIFFGAGLAEADRLTAPFPLGGCPCPWDPLDPFGLHKLVYPVLLLHFPFPHPRVFSRIVLQLY